jgi:hypothetical protein
MLEKKLTEDSLLESLSPGLGSLLNTQARVALIMTELREKLDNELAAHLTEYSEELTKQYPIKSRISEWINECVADEEVKIHVYKLKNGLKTILALYFL